jgi:hypothetical protein
MNIPPKPVGATLLDHNDSTFGLLASQDAHKTAPHGLFALGSLVVALPHNVFYNSQNKTTINPPKPVGADPRVCPAFRFPNWSSYAS